MAGRKVFSAGEVLQAADVNDFLMDQSVMVFAGTAARGSAIPSPTEGMVTYLSDSDELQVYTTAWGAVGGAIVGMESVSNGDVFVASVAAGASTAITGLSLNYTMKDSANKLYISGFIGIGSNSGLRGQIGVAPADDGSLIGLASVSGSKTRTTAGGRVDSDGSDQRVGNSLAFSFVYEPGDTAQHTYTLHAINPNTATQSLYVNRSVSSSDTADNPVTLSSLTVMEVAS